MKNKHHKSLKTYMILELIIFIIVTSIIALVFAILFINSEVLPVLDYDNAPYHSHQELFESGAFSEIDIEYELGKRAFFHVYEGTNLLYMSHRSSGKQLLSTKYLQWIPTIDVVQIKLDKLSDDLTIISYWSDENQLINYFKIYNDKITDGRTLNTINALGSEQIKLLNGYYKEFKIRRVTLQNGQIVVFFTPDFVVDSEAALSSQLATIALALLCIVIISTMLYLSRINSRITKPLEKLQLLIDQFEIGKVTEDGFLNGPKEFMYIVSKFDQMSLKTLKLQEEKEQSNLNKRKLLSEISHDLKTPMTVIKSYAEALNSNLLSPAEKEHYLETIIDKIDNLSGKIDEFYLYNKLESPDLPLNLNKIDIYEYVRTYLIDVYDDITNLGSQLDIHIPDQHASVQADVKLMNRALDNILFNSVKHNDTAVKIQVSVYREHDNLVIAIRDNGKGIQSDLIQAIFQPYVTDDASKPADQGSGLGLAIARRIIDRHGWELTAHSLAASDYSIEFCISVPLQ